MTDRLRPGMTARAQAEHQARLEREAAALRENLGRRKAQIRARIVVDPDVVKGTDKPKAK